MNPELALESRIVLTDDPTSALNPELLGDVCSPSRATSTRAALDLHSGDQVAYGGLVVEEGDPGASAIRRRNERACVQRPDLGDLPNLKVGWKRDFFRVSRGNRSGIQRGAGILVSRHRVVRQMRLSAATKGIMQPLRH